MGTAPGTDPGTGRNQGGPVNGQPPGFPTGPHPIPAAELAPKTSLFTTAVLNWKSSLASVLTVVIATGVYFAAVPNGVLSQKAALIVTLATGLAKVYLGLIQKD